MTMIIKNEMIDLNEFANEMTRVSANFDTDQIELIWSSIDDQTYGDTADLENDMDNGDNHFMFDANLHSLIDDLIYNGHDADSICCMVSTPYGRILDIFYLPDDNMYCIVIGWR